MGIKQIYEEMNKMIDSSEDNINDIVNDIWSQAQLELANKGDESEDNMDLGIVEIFEKED